MAFSITVPTNDEAAEAKIAAAYENDPGASPNGKYITADAAVNMSSNYPNLRFLVRPRPGRLSLAKITPPPSADEEYFYTPTDCIYCKLWMSQCAVSESRAAPA